jgi:predicted O-methyltransferase YrrM
VTDLVHHLDKDDRGMQDPNDPGELAGPGRGRRRISVTREEGALLRSFAYGCGRVLEIGTGLGIATRWMAEYVDWVDTVDIDPWVQENIWPRMPYNAAGLLERPVGRVYGMVFIDAEHTHDALNADIAFAREVTPPGALIVVHDAIELRETVRAQPGDWQIISTRYGLGIHARV